MYTIPNHTMVLDECKKYVVLTFGVDGVAMAGPPVLVNIFVSAELAVVPVPTMGMRYVVG